ncbi:hypothetical protein JTM11_31635, partial [Pseudomonas aeruginosa]|nr:hypothetical protein [Pseudomonas aeruginosa]
FFTSNLLVIEDWTPNRCATQSWGDVADKLVMFKVIENRFFSVIFEWYQHALASMIYRKNCLKTILQS